MSGTAEGAQGTTGEQLLLRVLQAQQEQMQAQQAQMEQLQRLVEQGQRPRGSVVDTKAIGRPEKLGGTLEEASRAWRQWHYRLELWLASQFSETRAILTWARTMDEEITITSIQSPVVTGVSPERVMEFNRQLEVVLGTLTIDTPGDIAMNSSPGSGLDMYRRLHMRLDPTDMVTSFRWLRALMSTKAVSDIGDLIPAVERWEDQRRRYAARKDCGALTERQKMVSLLGLVPPELQSHLELNLPRLNTYELLRREITTFAQNRRAFSAEDSGATPMEVDWAQGTGKGKGKGKKETRTCNICHKVGHIAKDCWRKGKEKGGSSGSSGYPLKTPGAPGKAKGGAKSKAQGSKGRGSGRGKGHARELEGEEGGEAEEPEQEAGEEEGDVGFLGMLGGDDPNKDRDQDDEESEEETGGAGSSRDPPASGRAKASAKAKAGGGTSSVTGVGLRLLQGSLTSELYKRQAELRESLSKATTDAEREGIEKQLDSIKEQLKALVASKKKAAGPQPGQKSTRFQADLDAGHDPKLAKRKEVSRQRAAKHRQAGREGRATERRELDDEWRKRYDRPLGKKDDGKEASYPLMPSNEERQARPLSRKARENLRQEGDDEPAEARPREWRRKPTTEGERVGKRRREAQRKQRQRGGEAAVAKAPPKRPKAKGSDRPAEPSGPPPPKRGPRYSQRLLAAIAASERVAKAIRAAPWRNLEDEEEAEDEGAGEGPVRDPPARKPVMGKSKILAAVGKRGVGNAEEDTKEEDYEGRKDWVSRGCP